MASYKFGKRADGGYYYVLLKSPGGGVQDDGHNFPTVADAKAYAKITVRKYGYAGYVVKNQAGNGITIPDW